MEQQDRIMDGDLQTLGLQSILKMLALSDKTGKLFVSSGPETLSISLRKGQIVDLHEEGIAQIDLLQMLCLLNRLRPFQAQAVKDLVQGNMQLSLAMLVERGWMTPAEMQQRLEFAVTQSISHALRWINGRFEFHRQLVPIESKMQPLDVDSVLLEALRQADEWEEIAGEGLAHLTHTTVARWQPEVTRDVRSLGLGQDYIEVLCLSNGELPLQAVSLALLTPEARIARIMAHLLELKLIEVVDTAMETNLLNHLSTVIVRCEHVLNEHKRSSTPLQHLLGLITTLSEGINGLLEHHGRYARSLRGRGHLPPMEIARYLERRFQPQHQALTRQYPILDTTSFNYGQLDCGGILTLDKVVKGEQLEEFYWEAVQGLSAFLRYAFSEALRDEVGISHTARQLSVAWKVFLSEFDREVQQYQVYRAHRNARQGRSREQAAPSLQSPPISIVQNWSAPQDGNGNYWSPEIQRRLN